MLTDTLYFGASIPDSTATVTLEDFETFLRTIVTPRYPGFTYWHATGAWQRDRESTYVLRIIHDDTERDARNVESIARIYKRRFHQQSVLRETTAAEVRFL